MSEKPELLPCPFCGCTTIIAATGPRAIRPYFECDGCGAEGPIEEPDEDPPQGWNVRSPAALADLATVKALVASDADLLLDSYKALLVLRRVLDKAGLMRGAETAENIADRIVAAHPEIPVRSAIRAEAATIRGETT